MGFDTDKNIMGLLLPFLMLISLNIQEVGLKNMAEEATYFFLFV